MSFRFLHLQLVPDGFRFCGAGECFLSESCCGQVVKFFDVPEHINHLSVAIRDGTRLQILRFSFRFRLSGPFLLQAYTDAFVFSVCVPQLAVRALVALVLVTLETFFRHELVAFLAVMHSGWNDSRRIDLNEDKRKLSLTTANLTCHIHRELLCCISYVKHSM